MSDKFKFKTRLYDGNEYVLVNDLKLLSLHYCSELNIANNMCHELDEKCSKLKNSLTVITDAYDIGVKARDKMRVENERLKKMSEKLRDALLLVSCHPSLDDEFWIHETIDKALGKNKGD